MLQNFRFNVHTRRCPALLNTYSLIEHALVYVEHFYIHISGPDHVLLELQ